MRTTLLFALGVIIVQALQPASANAATDCTQLRTEIEAAGSTPSSTSLQALHDQAVALPDCDAALIEHLLRRVAVAMSREASLDTLSADERLTILEGSLQYHRLWQVLKQLGDIAYESADYTAATRRYQETLEAIDDPETTQDRHVPEQQVVEEVYKLAEISRLLSEEYVAAPVNRDGDATGLGAPSVRGYQFSTVAVPITFRYNETQFDQQGQLAAQDLLAQLMAQGAPNITLVGHTDPRGSRRYNQTLSERRAAAVAGFLRGNGYSGNIQTVGQGEMRPYEVPNPQQFSRQELFRMSRRVEMQR